MRELLGALFVALVLATPVAAQQAPARVRVLTSQCAAMRWDALVAALHVELRSMGSDLASDASAPARLVLDVRCEGAITSVEVELSSTETHRVEARTIAIVDDDDSHGMRSLAVALSELVRVAWPALSRAEPEAVPPAAPPARVIDFEVLEREEAPSPADEHAGSAAQRPYVDALLGVSAYPASPSALGELRAATSFSVAGPLRAGIELASGLGWAWSPFGDVWLASVGGAGALRLAHGFDRSVMIEAGVRVDLAWLRAEGSPDGATLRAQAIEGFGLGVGLDARFRARVVDSTFLVVSLDVGAGLVGLDARAGMRSIAVSLGPRIGAAVGLAWSLDE